MEDELRRLLEENRDLRAASEAFGALAERLSQRLREAREAARARPDPRIRRTTAESAA